MHGLWGFVRLARGLRRAAWAGLAIGGLAGAVHADPLPSYSTLTPLAGDDHRHAGSAASHLKLARGVCTDSGLGDPHERGLNIAVYDAIRSAGYDWGNLSYHDWAISAGAQNQTFLDWIAPGPARGIDLRYGYQVIPTTSGFPDWTNCGTGGPADQPCSGSTGSNEALSHSTAANLKNTPGQFVAFSGREYTNGQNPHTVVIPAGDTDTVCRISRESPEQTVPVPEADRCANEGDLYRWIHRSSVDHGGGDGVLIRAHPEDPTTTSGQNWHPHYRPHGFSDRSIYGMEVGKQYATGPNWEVTYQRYLARGHRLFPTYGSDVHELHQTMSTCAGEHPPLLRTGATICWVEAGGAPWNRSHLIGAMRERRCYYSSAFKPRLEIEGCGLTTGAACAQMGGLLDAPDGRVRFKVRATNDPRSQGASASPRRRLGHVEVVNQQGTVLRSCTSCCARNDASGDVCEIDFSPVTFPSTGGAAYVRICEGPTACGADEDSTAVISSPVFVNWASFRVSVGQEPDSVYDTDGDGIEAQRDNCPAQANADQGNFDHDAFGDRCDPDCISSAIDPDGDGQYTCSRCIGPSPDSDGDGMPDACDNCPTVANGRAQAAVPRIGNQTDSDGDSIGDACDNCVYDPNPAAMPVAGRTTTGGQRDDDADGYGNACDPDFDNDGVVGANALADLTASHGKLVTSNDCGVSRSLPCDRFDLDGRDLTLGACVYDCPDATAFFRLLLDPQTGALLPTPRLGPKCPDCGVAFDALRCEGDACDPDGDGVPHSSDNCPFTTNPLQDDGDGDGVGDACDNCVNDPNSRAAPGFLEANPWAVLTGRQRDDDADGYGNVCDAKFVGVAGMPVSTADLREFRSSTGHERASASCGTAGSSRCAPFDLDENGAHISSPDLARFRELHAKMPGPKCAPCPLPCAAGTAASCTAAAP